MPPKGKGKGGNDQQGAAATAGPQGTVLALAFPDITTMARALARISAFVEDPEYEGVPLSLEEMSDLNLPCKRYAGHNFPLQSFDQCLPKLGQLSAIEQVVVRAIQEYSKAIRPRSLGYVIAHCAGDTATFTHERQHAVFFFNPDYRSRVEGIWNSVKVTYAPWARQFEDHLGKMYSARVHIDEFQAIISNREYECVQKLSQLVSSIVPKPETHNFQIINVALPKVLPPPEDDKEEEEDEDQAEGEKDEGRDEGDGE